MLAEKSAASAQPGVPVTANLRWAFILVTSLFFMWGLSYGLLDVLNKHFQETLHVTKAQSGLLQAAYFGAYFLVALPAGSCRARARGGRCSLSPAAWAAWKRRPTRTPRCWAMRRAPNGG